MATIAGLGVVALTPAPAAAHPLGNFTTNTYAELRVAPDSVEVLYVVDLAEIPTVQARPRIDTDADDELSRAERDRYASAQCQERAEGLRVQVTGRDVALDVAGTKLTFLPGQAGLSTQRLECLLEGASPTVGDETPVSLQDQNLPNRIGWREVVAIGDGTTIVSSDVPESSVSEQLTSYPDDQLSSPLRRTEADLRVKPGGPRLPGGFGTGQARRASDSFLSLVERRTLTVPFGLLAISIAFGFGAIHALAPGHGKTVMAAYLVGEKGSRRDALLLGITVAVTHTGGVFALALAVSNSSLAPESLYPWLGSLSGALVAAIGVALVIRAVRFRRQLRQYGPAGDGAAAEAGHHHHDGDGHTHDDGHGAAVGAGGHHPHDGHTHDGDGGEVAAPVVVGTSTLVGEPTPLPELVEELIPTAGDHHGHSGSAHGNHGHDRPHDHDPPHRHDHGHSQGHLHPHPHTHIEIDPDGPELRLRSLMMMGFAGGMVPTPSALVVLLGAIALGRAWFGLLLILAYGVGMAATLVTAGLVLERARGRVEQVLYRKTRPRLTRLAGALPLVTAVMVVLGGLLIAARALNLV